MQYRNTQTYWIRTTRLMAVLLALWLLFSVAVHAFVATLNRLTIPFLDLPLGFFMAAQGGLVAFAVMSFQFARRQDRIDRDHFLTDVAGTASSRGRADVNDRLRRICGICAAGFLLLILASVALDRLGIAGETIGPVAVLGMLTVYAVIGLASRTQSVAEYQVAGRSVPVVFAAMASGAEWTAAALVLGAMGSLFVSGHDGHALVLGLTGGYVLSAVLIAPFVRRSGASTLPDFLAARFDGGAIRWLAVIMLTICAFAFAVPLIGLAGAIVARALGLEIDLAVYCIVVTILLVVVPGGMRGLTATQVVQWVVLFVGCVALFLIYEIQRFDAPVGAMFDPAVDALRALLRGMGLAPSLSPRGVPFDVVEQASNIEFIVCLMLGTASFPHILMHPLTTSGVREARASLAWSLLCIAMIAFALPIFIALSGSEAETGRSGTVPALVAVVGTTAMLAAAGAPLLAIANSLVHDVGRRMLAFAAFPEGRLLFTRLLAIVATLLAGYLAMAWRGSPAAMVAWSFSLAAAGFFPALVLGIWYRRTTTPAVLCGMVAGFGLCLFYIVVSRYFPQAGVTHFGMASLVNPATGRPLVNVAQVLSEPRWLADVPASAANPLASKVGWFNVGNIAGGVFGVLTGFLTIVAISLLGRQPSARKAALIDSIRAPTATPLLKP
jgi:cation/acetate symporter